MLGTCLHQLCWCSRGYNKRVGYREALSAGGEERGTPGVSAFNDEQWACPYVKQRSMQQWVVRQ